MRNIKKIVLRLLLILVVLVVYEAGIKYAYEPNDVTVHATKQERKQMDGTIETVLCGTSLVQRTNLDSIDRELSTTTFNIASSVQPVDGSYYMIKDTVEKNPVKTIFFGVSIEGLVRETTDSKWKTLVYDGLESEENRLQYLIHGTDIDEWPYMCLYSARVDNYLAFSQVKDNFILKQTEEYQQGALHINLYRGRGRFGRKKSYNCKTTGTLKKGESTFSTEKLQKHQVTYLRKLIQYCKDKNIELILLHAPVTRDRINQYKDFTPIHDYYQSLAKEYQVPFWDFNYYKDLETVFPAEVFEDEKHMNLQGGDVFAQKLMEVYQSYKNGDGVEQYFQDECPYYQ